MKKIICIVCAAMLLLGSGVSAKTLEFQIGSSDMYISDKGISHTALDTKPFTINDRTMVPIRVISENFGAEVIWDEDSQTVTINTDEVNIKLTVGSQSAYVNGEEISLDTAPVTQDDRTMVPLRFISEALGRRVVYVDESEHILISDEMPIMNVSGKDVTLDDIKFLANYNGVAVNDISYDFVGYFLPYTAQVKSIAAYAENEGYRKSDEEVNDLVDTFYSYSDEIYSEALVGAGIDFFGDVFEASGYIDSLYDSITVSEELIQSIYDNTYICAKHILIPTINLQTGEPLAEDKKAEAKAQIEMIYEKIKNGEDFDALMNEYSQDTGLKDYPDGYVFTGGEMVSAFEDAVFALGDIEGINLSGIVESEYGYHIIKRVPLPEQIDEYTRSKIGMTAIDMELERIYDDILENAAVEMYMSDNEIIEALK